MYVYNSTDKKTILCNANNINLQRWKKFCEVELVELKLRLSKAMDDYLLLRILFPLSMRYRCRQAVKTTEEGGQNGAQTSHSAVEVFSGIHAKHMWTDSH